MAEVFGFDTYSPKEIAETVETVGVAKASLPFWDAFFTGILCNILLCVAVWLALAGRSVVDKICAVVFPISAFFIYQRGKGETKSA